MTALHCVFHLPICSETDTSHKAYSIVQHKGAEQYLATAVTFMGGQATGEVKLRSKDPKDPPLIDPKFLSHPYDRRVAIESVREALEFLDLPNLAKDQVRLAKGPAGRSDEEILVNLPRFQTSFFPLTLSSHC